MIDEALSEAAAQVRAGEYFEAHDTLEEQWHRVPDGELRVALQGLIQLCAGLHKRKLKQDAGADYLLARGKDKLSRHRAALPPAAAGLLAEIAILVP